MAAFDVKWAVAFVIEQAATSTVAWLTASAVRQVTAFIVHVLVL